MSKEKNTSKFEKAWYVISILLFVWAIAYIVLGIIARNLSSSSALSKADAHYAEHMKFGFFGSGLIVLGCATVIILITLLVSAKKVDREYEKNERRAARLAQIKANAGEETVVDVEPTKAE